MNYIETAKKILLKEEIDNQKLLESSLSRIQSKIANYTSGTISAFRNEYTRKQNLSRNKDMAAYLRSKGYSITKIVGSWAEELSADKQGSGEIVLKVGDESIVKIKGDNDVLVRRIDGNNYEMPIVKFDKSRDEYTVDASKMKKFVNEESFFVVNMSKLGDDGGQLQKDLMALGKKYNQDSILMIPSGGKDAYLVGTSNRDGAFPGSYGATENIGSANYGKVMSDIMSKIRGRPFAFESIEEWTDPKTYHGMLGMKAVGLRIEKELRNELT